MSSIMKKITIKHSKLAPGVDPVENDQEPKIVTIDGSEYYSASELQKYDPVFFYGCAKTVRKIIVLKHIPQDQYVYASYNVRTGWNIAKDQNKPANKVGLWISKDWVHENIQSMAPKEESIKNKKTTKIPKSSSSKGVNTSINILPAPRILVLNDNEKFKDNEGNIIEIETCGERTHDGIYFLLTDVAKGFEMPNLATSLLHKDKGYEHHTHYEFFIRSSLPNGQGRTNKKQIYVTYIGMLKILFTSRNGVTNRFVKWASETLFTVQMGTIEQKKELASDMLGVSAEDVANFLYYSTTPIPCVYRFALGKVKDLRDVMNVSDDVPDHHIIVKYGFTDNLRRRAQEHKRTYETIDSRCNVTLLGFVYIDRQHLSSAESSVKFHMKINAKKLAYKNSEEIFTYDPSKEGDMDRFFGEIASRYSGCLKELNEQHANAIMARDQRIITLEHKLELQEALHKNEIKDLEREIMILNYKQMDRKNIDKKRKQDYDVENIKIGR